MSGSLRSDEGFSLLEVLFAAFIAFFVLTALFGVLVGSTQLGKSAQIQESGAQLANQVIEQIRALPYASVGTTNAPFGSPAGVLPSSETTTYQGLTYTITRQVTWVDDPGNNSGGGVVNQDYKRVVVIVRWSGGTPVRAETLISEKTVSFSIGPTVSWVSSYMPPSRTSVLFTSPLDGTQAAVWAGNPADPPGYVGSPQTPASLVASASVGTTTGVLSHVTFSVDGVAFQNGQYEASTVTWINDGVGSNPAQFRINLTATDASGSPIVADGYRRFKVTAYDNFGASGYAFWYALVDNSAGSFSGSAYPTLTACSRNTSRTAGPNLSLNMTWSAPPDGTDPVYMYDVLLKANGAVNATAYPWCYLGSSGSCGLRSGSPTTGTALLPFTVYEAALRTRSPRGLTGNTSQFSAKCVTNPNLTGSVKNSGANKNNPSWKATLKIGAPPANLAALMGGTSVVYDLYEATAFTANLPGPAVASDQATTTLTRGPWTNKNNPPAFYHQIVAKIRNAGGQVIYTVPSEVIGPTPAPDPGLTATMTPVVD